SDGGQAETINVPQTGWYRIELWGSQGGFARQMGTTLYEGGKGGYTAGDIYLTAGDKLYMYLGGGGNNRTPGSTKAYEASYNGGGRASNQQSHGAGGGATDVRTVAASTPEPSNDAVSLASRIMVAAGGGGAVARFNGNEPSDTKPNVGGYAGGLIGGPGKGSSAPAGATQIAAQRNGGFGRGGAGIGPSSGGESVGGGGGGWQGGGAGSYNSNNSSGSGGSSYISGYPGCVATTSTTGFTASTDGTENSVLRATSWTNKTFTNTVMKAGNELITEPDGTEATGHSGAGFARIIFLGSSD
ncbi:MAG: hypothetical protein LBC72_03875, partial [Spirochaetaceae bacterium]|nr:hypothetical protein [Spirochaetaceae bacterium]